MSSNGFGSDSNELEIANGFYRIAQTELAAEEAQDFGGALQDAAAPNDAEADQVAPTDNPDIGNDLPSLDTDMDEMQAIKNLIPWDSFGIIFDTHYAKLLEESIGLPPTKAKAKSFFIYFSPENKRLEGVVNKRYIGGYGTKEDLGDDFSFLKTLSPEGFSPDWKEKLLTDIDEMPAVENSNMRESLREKAKESDEDEEVQIGDEVAKEGIDEVAQSEGPGEMAPPTPVGNVNTDELDMAARMRDIAMRRMSRIKAFKNA